MQASSQADGIERQQECSSSVQWKTSWPGDRGHNANKGELVNGMLLMSPHGRSSWRPPADEEEAVDLTEPRLETFTQPAMFR